MNWGWIRWTIDHVNRGYGLVTSLEYNNRSWLTKLTSPDPGGAAPVIQYGYNTRGDRTSVTDALGNARQIGEYVCPRKFVRFLGTGIALGARRPGIGNLLSPR